MFNCFSWGIPGETEFLKKPRISLEKPLEGHSVNIHVHNERFLAAQEPWNNSFEPHFSSQEIRNGIILYIIYIYIYIYIIVAQNETQNMLFF